MAILIPWLSECMLLAALISVIAFARRLPPKCAGLAAAVLVSAALGVEFCGMGSIIESGEAAAAAAANRKAGMTDQVGPSRAPHLHAQIQVPDNRGDLIQKRGPSIY